MPFPLEHDQLRDSALLFHSVEKRLRLQHLDERAPQREDQVPVEIRLLRDGDSRGALRAVTAQLTHAGGFAYPSGHAAGTTALAGAVLLIYLPLAPNAFHRWAAIAASVLGVIAVATSRVYLGVHWLTDVVGGMLLAICVVLAVAAFIPPPNRIPQRDLTAEAVSHDH